jgi:hypothetical protein
VIGAHPARDYTRAIRAAEAASIAHDQQAGLLRACLRAQRFDS